MTLNFGGQFRFWFSLVLLKGHFIHVPKWNFAPLSF